MAREILFKAKGMTKDWHCGLLSNLKENICTINNSIGNTYICNGNTLCQYTGLEDVNGKPIFENDILMAHSNSKDLVKVCYGEFYVVDMETLEKIDRVIGWHYEVIETDALSKCEPFNISMPLTSEYVNTCEFVVIGNIFDNPELLGGGE